jgi:hypothetical protein
LIAALGAAKSPGLMATVEREHAGKAMGGPPSALRQSVVLAARRFKASWVELGRLLTQVRDEALFEQWGYPSFEAYCLAELRIRKPTAMKLTRNFSFLERHEPERSQAPQVAESAPAFEVVEVLAQAEERGQLSAQEYKSVRDSIWNQEKPTSELRRELTGRFPAPEPPPDQLAEVKRLWTMAKRLHAELSASRKMPKAVVERAAALAADLEELAARKADA